MASLERVTPQRPTVSPKIQCLLHFFPKVSKIYATFMQELTDELTLFTF